MVTDIITDATRPEPGSREALLAATAGRHHAVTEIIRHFAWSHLPPRLQDVSRPVSVLALDMTAELPDGPELTAGLRKLLEAKDCFVRAAL
jgi:hypothetical protein